MGSIQVDTYSKEKRINDIFEYNEAGIKLMLESYYELVNDISTIDIKIDLDRALCCSILTPNQRVILMHIYSFQLNILQTAKLLKRSILSVKNELDEAFQVLEAVMNGYKTKGIQVRKSCARSLNDFTTEVLNGLVHMFDVPRIVIKELLYKLETEQNDILAAAKVKSKTNYIKNYGPINIEDYPFHETSAAIESPTNRKYDPIRDGYDYFAKQDMNNHVTRGIDFNFPANLKAVGRKKTSIKKNSVYSGVKDIVYQ